MEHALRCAPDECVGLLIGLDLGDEVLDFVPLSNVHCVPRHGFALDSLEVARHLHRGVVGLYHSHPGQDPNPSCWDLIPEGWHYWIVDPLGGRWYQRVAGRQ